MTSKVAFFLLLALIYSDKSSAQVREKFIEAQIVPDILDLNSLPNPLGSLNISYPSGVNVTLGNELTPTQVKDKPEVKWNSVSGMHYALLMTGKYSFQF